MRPYLDETFVAWPFSEVAIELSPSSPGVYLRQYLRAHRERYGRRVPACNGSAPAE